MASPATPMDAIGLARTLPPRLLRFFTKYPPRNPPTSPIPPQTSTILDPKTSKEVNISIPNNRHITTHPPFADPSFNPFLPWLNPLTSRWRAPVFSLRQQADICKLARKHGVEELLPWSRKMRGVREARMADGGFKGKGTGVGQSVKGHKSERKLIATTEERRRAMEKMPELIREWKLKGHGKGWKKWPK